MGTVIGSIPFYYDTVSDDTLNDDLMEIFRNETIAAAIKKQPEVNPNDAFHDIPSHGITVNPNSTTTRHW